MDDGRDATAVLGTRARRARPSPAALAWAVEAVAPGGKLHSVRHLVGGITSAVHGLVIEGRDAVRHRAVMRRWLHPGAGSLVRREAAVLSGLGQTDIPAPALIAADVTGVRAETPALLMEWLPGRADLAPNDPTEWIRALAKTAAAIHRLRIVAPPFDDWFGPKSAGAFAWSSRPQDWRRAMELVSGHDAPFEPSLVHGDFQHFNMLWIGPKLSGVVDWNRAGIGPSGLDTGRCRLNLAVLFSVEWAERFRVAYESEAGRPLDPWWDLYSLTCYGDAWPSFIPVQVANRAQVDVAGMHQRVDDLLMSVLRRT
jgi:aminoglycoside phosphotransferase (APT) family kinase protein